MHHGRAPRAGEAASTFNIRVTTAERHDMNARAATLGVPAGEYVRRLIAADVARHAAAVREPEATGEARNAG